MSSTKELSKNRDLTISITVSKSPQEVYNAIKDVKAWWIGDIKGNGDKVGSEFTYRYKNFHESAQKVIELVPNKRVAWRVEDANLSFAKNKSEWKGTEIIFEIMPKGDQTEIQFTHKGLTPELECFDNCSAGWEFYVIKSLKNLLTQGEGLDPGF
jgi:uncharacterized protein YndB with AHSA1/START domain